MFETLYTASILILVIVAGHVLTRMGIFDPEEDFDTISKMVMRFTLPCAVMVKLDGTTFQLNFLWICVLGFACNWIYLGVAYLWGRNRTERSFMAINLNGYNIGNFALPFISYFLDGLPILAVSLFDAGSTLMVMGGNYAVARTYRGDESNIEIPKLLRSLLSPTGAVYLLMMFLGYFNLRLPQLVIDAAGVAGGANTFLSMFMIGIALNIVLPKGNISLLVRTLFGRYTIATAIACFIYFVLPFDLEIRQALVILSFAPVAGLAPSFTRLLKEDFELSAAINSLTILFSMVIMSGLFIFFTG